MNPCCTRQEWSVACHDVAGRERHLVVIVDHGDVALLGPPGEVAILSPVNVGRLRAALHAADTARE